MTFEEVKVKLTKLLETPDTALANLGPVLDEIKTDYEGFLSTTTHLQKAQDRIRDLQDTNMKLFLAQTGGSSDSNENDDDDLTGDEALKKFVDSIDDL